jgi:hypothetical protein
MGAFSGLEQCSGTREKQHSIGQDACTTREKILFLRSVKIFFMVYLCL